MGLDTTFGAPHGNGGFGNIQAFPVTQQEGLALTRRQILQGFLDEIQGFGLQQGGLGQGKRANFLIYFNVFKRVARIVGITLEGGQGNQMPGTRACPAIVVADGILQDALEQQRQLAGRSVSILFRQAHHRILDDIQSDILVAHRK